MQSDSVRAGRWVGCLFAAGWLALSSLPVPGQGFDGWRLMPVRTQGEFERGEPGGRAEQWLQGAARCRADPGVIYLSHDCGQVWRSHDGGRSWGKPLDLGLYQQMGQSIEVDPVRCGRVLLILDNAYDWRNPAFAGLYRSEDGGDHWDFVMPGPTMNSRRYEHNLAFAPSSVDAGGARRWYAALYNEPDQPGHADSALYASDDYGATFSRMAALTDAFPVYEVQVSPDDADVVLVASGAGLLRSADGGRTLARVTALPDGEVTSVAWAADAAGTVFAVVRGGGAPGVYRGTDGGAFARITTGNASHQAVLDDARRVFLHPADAQVLYVIPEGSSGGRTAMRSRDGGATFALTTISLPADVREWRWGINISGAFAFVLMSASDANDVVAQSGGAALYRSQDGLAFENGSTLYDGANCGLARYGVIFDPADPARFALGNADIGLYLTENGADWFEDRGVPWEWIRDSRVAWSSQHTADFRPGHPGEMLAVAGDVFDKKLVRTADDGRTWEIVDEVENWYWRVAFHPQDPDVAWAGDRRSLDGGRSFARLPFPAALDDSDLQVMDFCRADPDVIYAASRSSRRILRSDDRGDTWSLYATAALLAPFDPIMTFAVDPGNCDRVYALDARGDLARYDGAGWESLGALAHSPGPAGYYNFVRAIGIDPRHPEVIYAGVFGSGIPAILRSQDDGRTWEDISYNHFRQSVSQIDVSPHSGEVFVGGCSGTRVLPPPYPSSGGIYGKLYSIPSCFDGLQNGEEGGIDCGGACAVACVQTDGGADASDAGGDAGMDAGADAGPDAADAPADSGPDGGQDAGADSGADPGDGGWRDRLTGGCGCQAGAGPAAGLLFAGGLFLVGCLRWYRRRRHRRT